MAENSLLIGLRNSHKKSTEEVALEAGMTEEHYMKLESGELKIKIDDAGKLSVVYKIEPEVFLQSQSHITNNNMGEFSKGVVYATNYFDGLSINDIRKLKDQNIL